MTGSIKSSNSESVESARSYLTGKLSEALKIVHANVTKEMKAAEAQIISAQERIAVHEDGAAKGI